MRAQFRSRQAAAMCARFQVDVAFGGWCETAKLQVSLAECLSAVLGRYLAMEKAEALYRWRGTVTRGRQLTYLMLRSIRAWWFRRLHTALSGWRDSVEQSHAQNQHVSQWISHALYSALFIAFSLWLQQVAWSHAVPTIVTRAAERFLQPALFTLQTRALPLESIETRRCVLACMQQGTALLAG